MDQLIELIRQQMIINCMQQRVGVSPELQEKWLAMQIKLMDDKTFLQSNRGCPACGHHALFTDIKVLNWPKL